MSPKQKLAWIVDQLNALDGQLAVVQLKEHELSLESQPLIRIRALLSEHLARLRLSMAA